MSDRTIKPRPWFAFSSSSGETFRALWNALSPETHAQCRGFLADRPCLAQARARELLPAATPVHEFKKNDFERGALDVLRAHANDRPLVLLCGFFGILSATFIEECAAPVLNTHPSLLPAFPGLDRGVHRRAFEAVTVSGFTVHLVTEALDGGPVLFQHPVWLDARLSDDQAREQVRAAEQRYLPIFWERALRTALEPSDRQRTSLELRRKHPELNFCTFDGTFDGRTVDGRTSPEGTPL